MTELGQNHIFGFLSSGLLCFSYNKYPLSSVIFYDNLFHFTFKNNFKEWGQNNWTPIEPYYSQQHYLNQPIFWSYHLFLSEQSHIYKFNLFSLSPQHKDNSKFWQGKGSKEPHTLPLKGSQNIPFSTILFFF